MYDWYKHALRRLSNYESYTEISGKRRDFIHEHSLHTERKNCCLQVDCDGSIEELPLSLLLSPLIIHILPQLLLFFSWSTFDFIRFYEPALAHLPAIRK